MAVGYTIYIYIYINISGPMSSRNSYEQKICHINLASGMLYRQLDIRLRGSMEKTKTLHLYLHTRMCWRCAVEETLLPVVGSEIIS